MWYHWAALIWFGVSVVKDIYYQITHRFIDFDDRMSSITISLFHAALFYWALSNIRK